MLRSVILVTITLGLLLDSVASLRCYQQSSNDRGYKPKEAESTVCEYGATQCVKITGSGTISDPRTGQTTSVSGSLFDCDNHGLCNAVGVRNNECRSYKGTNICCCSGELCNSSVKHGSLFAIFLFLASNILSPQF